MTAGPSPIVRLRVPDAQRRAWTDHAIRHGFTRDDGQEANLSGWLKAIAADATEADDRAPGEILAELAALRREVARVGSNLNQLARAGNISGLSSLDVQRLRRTHGELKELAPALDRAVQDRLRRRA